MKYQTLLTSSENNIYIITINRPEKLNALNKTVIEELSEPGAPYQAPQARDPASGSKLSRQFQELPKKTEEKMKHKSSYIALATGLASSMLAGWLLVACSETTGAAPNAIQRAQGEAPAPPPPSGFLGSDYALLQPPAGNQYCVQTVLGQPCTAQKAALAYTNPNVSFTSYSKIIISPVTYWADSDSTISADQQQVLCNYFYGVLQKDFSQNFSVVTLPGPGVAKLSVALIDATAATPGLRTIGIIDPYGVSIAKYAATGTFPGVGSATGAAKLTDSVSGQLLAAWEDKQFGTEAARDVTVWKWGDAEHAMNYWAAGLNQRLAALGIQHTGTTAGAS